MKKAEGLNVWTKVLMTIIIALTAVVCMFSTNAFAASSKGGFSVPSTLTVQVGGKSTLNVTKTTSKYKKTKFSYSYSSKKVSASTNSSSVTFTGKKSGSFTCKVTVKAYKKASSKKASKTVKLTCKVKVVKGEVLGAEDETSVVSYIASQTPVTDADSSSFRDVSAAYTALNTFRASNNLGSLAYDASLENCAKLRAKEQWIQYYQNNTATHTRPGGYSWQTAYPSTVGVKAENLGWGYSSSDTSIITSGWANSETHRKVMLESGTRVGIACYEVNGQTCWALCVGK